MSTPEYTDCRLCTVPTDRADGVCKFCVDYVPPHPVWTPQDTAALREVADQYPVEVGQSPMLRLITEQEGLNW